MSTRGFISIKHDNKIIGTYNHSDSYPTWLGVRMVRIIQQNDLDAIAAKLDTIVIVDEDESPTAAQLADLKERGFWANVSTGSDWYSALRNAQGNLAAYIEAGYIPRFDVQHFLDKGDCFIEYGYVVDLDECLLIVFEYGKEGASMPILGTVPFDDILAPGFDATSVMEQIENRGNK